MRAAPLRGIPVFVFLAFCLAVPAGAQTGSAAFRQYAPSVSASRPTGVWASYGDPSRLAGLFPVSPRFEAGFHIVVFSEFEGNRIGLRNPDGEIQEFQIPTADSGPGGITLGLGGYWFTEFRANKIGRANLLTGPADFPKFINGGFVEFSIPTPNSGPRAIVNGPGGLWFTESLSGKTGRITAEGVFTEFPIPTPDSGPMGIAAGTDSVWFTERNANKIGRLDTKTGVITEYAIPTPSSEPIELVEYGGVVWFTEFAGNKIGRINDRGEITEYPLPSPAGGPWGIVVRKRGPFSFGYDQPGSLGSGTDGVWFTEKLGNRVGELLPDGRIIEFPIPAADAQPEGIVSSGEYLWFAETRSNSIGRAIEDSLVGVGVGGVRGWAAGSDIGNPGPVLDLWLSDHPRPLAVPSILPLPVPCSSPVTLQIPANATLKKELSGGVCNQDLAPLRFLTPLSTAPAPTVHARVSKVSQPAQAADFPFVRLSRVAQIDPAVLFFPGASTGNGAQVNLFLADVGQDGGAVILVEAFSAEGELRGSRQTEVGKLAILPVLSWLGVTDLQNGAVRVTKIRGNGLLWGSLATVSADGQLSLTLGANP